MKNKIDLFLGFLIGILASLLGCFLFIFVFTDFKFFEGLLLLKSRGEMGKIITLGTVLDLVLFWTLLKYHKEFLARGVILSVIVLTIITLFL